MGSQGFFGSSTSGSSGGVAYSERTETVTRIAYAGQQGFFLPVGVFARISDIISVKYGGVSQNQGTDYDLMRRNASQGWPQPSTSDVSNGIWLSFPAVVNAVVEITFRVRRLLDVMPPLLALLPGSGPLIPDPGAPGATVRANYTSVPTPPLVELPNQLSLRTVSGLCVEFWRWTKHNARTRGASGIYPFVQQRFGRHWSPFFRTTPAISSGEIIVDPRAGGWIRYARPYQDKFRACFFDPSTGARGDFGEQVLIASGRDEFTHAGLSHISHCLWVVGR